MFGADIFVIDVSRLFDGTFDGLHRAWRQRKFTWTDCVWTALNQLLDFVGYIVRIHTKRLEHVSREPGFLPNQSQQNMFGADVLVVEALRFLPGQTDDLSGSGSKCFKHDNQLP